MRLERPAALSGAITGPAFVAGIVGAAKIATTRIPMPGAPADDVRRYYSDNQRAVRFSVVGQALSIRWQSAGWLIPIGRFSGYVLSGIAGTRMARRWPAG